MSPPPGPTPHGVDRDAETLGDRSGRQAVRVAQEHHLGPPGGKGRQAGGEGFESLASFQGRAGVGQSLGACSAVFALPTSGLLPVSLAYEPTHDLVEPGTGPAGFGSPRGHPGALHDLIGVVPVPDEAGGQGA